MNIFLKFLNSRWFLLFLFIFFFAVALLLYYPYILSGQYFMSGDGTTAMANKAFAFQVLRQGELPLWNKYLQNGAPYLADITNNPLYPVSALFGFLPIKWFSYCYYAFHLALGSLFTYLYLKLIGCRRLVAFCTALLYDLSIHLGSYRKSHIIIIACIVYLPVILYYLERYLQSRNLLFLALSSAAMALQFYAAFIQDVLYTDIVVFVYFIVLGVRYRHKLLFLCKSIIAWIAMYIGFIGPQILPTLQLVTTYKEDSSFLLSFDAFQELSIGPIKLLIMLFPKMFGDLNFPFPMLGSSGMDNELFMGVSALFIMLLGAFKYWRDFWIRLSTSFMLIAFMYGANAHIPLLSKLLYSLPVLGSFRVHSRILFVFTFFGFVLFAVTLSKLCVPSEWKGASTYAALYLSFAGMVAMASVSIMKVSPSVFNELRPYFIDARDYFTCAFLPGLLIAFFIFIFSMLFFGHLPQMFSRHKRAFSFLICGIVSLTALFEILPYTKLTTPDSANALNMDNISFEISSEIGNAKMLDALPGMNGGYYSILSQHKNLVKQIPAINSFASFNNPRLFKLFNKGNIPPFNFSGLLTGFVNIEENLKYDNDLLSMLGVKYVLDNFNLIGDNGESYTFADIKNTILIENEIMINPSELFVYSKQVDIAPNTVYSIEFNAETTTIPKSFYVDFFGGEQYDKSEQDVTFNVLPGQENYINSIFSGEIPQDQDIHIRIVAITDSPIKITGFSCLERLTTIHENTYISFYMDDTNRIYENKNVKDILYTVNKIVPLVNEEALYMGRFAYSFLDTSYVDRHEEMDLTGIDTNINIEYFKYNSIKASVTSSAPTFVNFSQNYYPGWMAYVNGEKVPIYEVNGLIQGIDIPAGTSVIEFKFTVPMLLWGIAVMLLTVIITCITIMKSKQETADGKIGGN